MQWIKYIDSNQIQQSSILDNFDRIPMKDVGGSIYDFSGHLDFKTDEEAQKFYYNSYNHNLISIIINQEKESKYEIRSTYRNGKKVIFLAHSL